MSFPRSLSLLPRASANISQLITRSVFTSPTTSPSLCLSSHLSPRIPSQSSLMAAAQRNYCSSNGAKSFHNQPTTNNQKASEEIPVQDTSSNSNSRKKETGGQHNLQVNEWDDFFPFGRRGRRHFFDGLDFPFGHFGHLRRSLRQLPYWAHREPRQPANNEAEERVASSVRDMMYDFDAELVKPVSLTLVEKDTEYTAKLHLKGFQKSDLNIRLQDEYLVVNGSMTNDEFSDRKGSGKMHTYSSQSFSRVLNLPDDVDRSKIHAKFENNELVIQLPKDSKKKHEIEIH